MDAQLPSDFPRRVFGMRTNPLGFLRFMLLSRPSWKPRATTTLGPSQSHSENEISSDFRIFPIVKPYVYTIYIFWHPLQHRFAPRVFEMRTNPLGFLRFMLLPQASWKPRATATLGRSQSRFQKKKSEKTGASYIRPA